MFGNPETTPGGKALKFYASIRIDVRRMDSLKDGDGIMGNRTKAKIVKNKLAPPFKQAEFDIVFGEAFRRKAVSSIWACSTTSSLKAAHGSAITATKWRRAAKKCANI